MIDFTSPEPPKGIRDPLWPGDVARIFQVNPKTVSHWAKTGRITGFRTPGGRRRYSWAEIAAIGRGCTAPAAAIHDPAASSATLSIGGTIWDLYLNPVAPETSQPGHAAIIVGATRKGALVQLKTTSLEWLDDLESAIQAARARGVIQAGMTVAAVQ